MRGRRSVAGPLILIAIGVLFLVHTLQPDFRIVEIFARSWPYFLIAWGVVQLAEVAVWASRGTPIPYNGVSGGSWVLVLLICFAGFGMYQVQRSGGWWRQVGFERGIEMLGDEHDFTITPVDKTVGEAPHIVVENFRGDAKITGVAGTTLALTGSKAIHALDASGAGRINDQTPVEVLVQGKTVIVRCNQDRASNQHTSIATNLALSVPKGASLELTGTQGDFEITSLAGDVTVSSENAGVRVEDLAGNLHVDTRRSDEIRATHVHGNVILRGRGEDVALSNIAGEVNVSGDYSGLVTLADCAKPVRVQSMRTEFDAQRVAGEIKLARGSLNGHGLTGPVKVNTRATDVTLAEYSDDLDLSVDKGDIDLRPQHVPLGKMAVRTGSGDIELTLPLAAITVTAATEHGDIESELGPNFAQHSAGQGSQLEGSNGSGPAVNLSTHRGDITLHKAGAPPPPPVAHAAAQTGNDEEL